MSDRLTTFAAGGAGAALTIASALQADWLNAWHIAGVGVSFAITVWILMGGLEQ